MCTYTYRVIYKSIITPQLSTVENPLIIEKITFNLVQVEATSSLLGHIPNRLGVHYLEYYSSTLKSHIKHIKGCGMGNYV